MKYGIRTIDDFDVKGKTVILRVDINQPVNKDTEELEDITRIKGCAPTVKELSDKGAKLVVLAHQGSDIEYKNYHNLKPHAKVLGDLIGKTVMHISDICGAYAQMRIRELSDGEILLLDNVRFMAEEMTLFETNLKLTPQQMANTQVVKKLAPLADIYICDAFAAAHRAQPSLVGFQQVLPSGMGRLFEKEYAILSDILQKPKRPCVFVLGGAKIQDAFMMMGKVLKDGIADKVLTGGLLSNIMLMAKEVDIGKASEDFIYKRGFEPFIEQSQEILEQYGDRIVLPDDLAYVNDTGRHEAGIDDLPQDEMLIDIGAKTIHNYEQILSAAGTIFVNGPMGVFEKELSAGGTRAVWQAIAASDGFSVVGGGDSVAAANMFGVSDEVDYICTGGGALVRFLSGEELPVVKALKGACVVGDIKLNVRSHDRYGEQINI
jgi:phosphoglycerate kinase